MADRFSFGWVSAFQETLQYLPYIIPFAITTVIGGIDCTESAASAGDKYSTGSIIGVEAIATIIAGFCGGVVQTTPYIGHPAYKAMGGRAAYTLATALFVGAPGVIGYFGLLFAWIPEAAVLPILIFVGIEITAQSFHATQPPPLRCLGICVHSSFRQIDHNLLGTLFKLSELGCYLRPNNLLTGSEFSQADSSSPACFGALQWPTSSIENSKRQRSTC
ncbi:MAG: hypothetical protein R3C03_20410 [Pirellulaceae bacterium]